MSSGRDDQISINRTALNEVRRKVSNVIENIGDSISSANKSVMFAEYSGWNDKSYYKFSSKYNEGVAKIKEGLKIFEEELLQELKKIDMMFEE